MVLGVVDALRSGAPVSYDINWILRKLKRGALRVDNTDHVPSTTGNPQRIGEAFDHAFRALLRGVNGLDAEHRFSARRVPHRLARLRYPEWVANSLTLEIERQIGVVERFATRPGDDDCELLHAAYFIASTEAMLKAGPSRFLGRYGRSSEEHARMVEVYRALGFRPLPSPPETDAELFARFSASGDAIAELRLLLNRARAQPWLTAQRRCLLGVTLQSEALHGTFDILHDATMIEVKVSKIPTIKREWLAQLLCYACLWEAGHPGERLDGIGVYMARQGQLIRLPFKGNVHRTSLARLKRIVSQRNEWNITIAAELDIDVPLDPSIVLTMDGYYQVAATATGASQTPTPGSQDDESEST